MTRENLEAQMAEAKKTFECKECHAEFETRDALRKHIYDEHLSDDDRRQDPNDKNRVKDPAK